MAMHSGHKMTEAEKMKIREQFNLTTVNADIDVSDWSIGKLRAKCEINGIRAGKMKRPELTRRVKRIIYEESQPVEFIEGERI